jgi:hypothetical protein
VFDFKIVSGTGQIRGQETGQKLKFLSHTEPQNNFLSSHIEPQNLFSKKFSGEGVWKQRRYTG